ncbi:MAG: hypothetical protein SFW67_10150 [Myxococcaceae bacterium]|nr:hypothetical protein [Myxococcaceae bacterium]
MLSVLVALSLGGVEVAPGTPCVSAPTFQERLSAAGVVLRPTVLVRLEPSPPEGVLVRYLSKDATLERRVPAPANDCEAVTRVVVALVQAWASPGLVEPPRAGRDAGPGSLRADAGLLLVAADAGPADGDARQAGSVSRVVPSTPDAGPGRDGSGSSVGPLDAGPGVRQTDLRATADAGPGRDGGAAERAVRPVESTVRSVADAGANDRGDRPGDVVGLPLSTMSDAGLDARLGVDGGNDRAARPVEPVGLPLRSMGEAGPEATSPTDSSASRSPTSNAGPEALVGPSADAGVTPPDAGSTRLVTSPDAGATEGPAWTFGVGLLGGVASGATSDVLPAGQLVVDLTRGWLGVAIDVGLSGATTSTQDGGTARSSWQWASASARLAIPIRDRLLLEAQVGVRGYRVLASATGFEQVDPEQVLLSVGAAGSVGASFRVVGPLGITLRLTGTTRRPESFFISQLGSVLETGPLEGSVMAGLVARF